MNQIDGTESVLIGNWHARLPSAICTDPVIFNSIFSIDTWENVLGTEAKQRILQKLPKEVLSCQGLGVQTIYDLLSGELSRFSSTPLETFFNQLDGGLFEPSVVPTKEAIKTVWRKDTKRIIKKCQIKVLQELLVSTTKYLEDNFSSKDIQTNGIGPAHNSFASKPSKDSMNGNKSSRATTTQNAVGIENELKKRVRKRFLSELSEINTQGNCASSDDEEFPVVKKPTRHTFGGEPKKQAPGRSNKINQSKPNKHPVDRQIRSNVSAAVNSSGIKALAPQQHTNTFSPAPVKPASRPTTLKSKEEQTAVQMAKFPKILPAPSVVSLTETISKSVPVKDDTNARTPTASTSSQIRNSPLLASQLQAPIISSNKHSSQSDMQLANRVLQMQSNAGSNFSRTPFEISIDDMESSSDDEFESIEPTIGFASNASLPGSRSFPSKAKGFKGTGRNLQPTIKAKGKISTSKLSTSNTKLTPIPTTSSTQTVSSTSGASNSAPSSSLVVNTISTESAKVSTQTSSATQAPILLGVTPTPSTSSAGSVNLQTPPILLTSGNPVHATQAIPSSSSSRQSHGQPVTTNMPPTIKLTPGIVANTVGTTNKLFSTLTSGVAALPDGQVTSIATTVSGRPTQPVTSFNSASATGNSNVVFVPVKSKEAAQNEVAKNSPVFRIQCGPSSQTFTASMNTTTPVTSKQYLTSSRISGLLGPTLFPPITLQDLNFSLNSDGNVVQSQSNTSEQKLLSESGEDKIDDLSVLDGLPFDSIPNLSDDLDGFDLDLVEVCDFHSLVSEEKHYASFFSLIRDVLCSTKDHRMTFICLEKTIRKWSISPSAPSNTWFIRVSDWNAALSTALNFLAGNYQDAHPEDFVPYIEYKYKTKYYQWIGAGRDSDNNMLPLCNMWLENLGRLPPIKKLEAEPDEPEEDDEDNEDSDSPDVEIKKKPKRPITPPPPRCVTTWTVRPSNDEERDYFQEQERQRFENPHKAFTYRMHDYESVVGPVKGVYSSQSGVTNKARGHSLLIDDRPPYVTILALVRDAVARLPNGEGTRSEICEMLRDSAFLAPEASNVTLNSVVSGALDRLHYERDPCVRYDSHKKSWIYLHRDRNQEQFERLHHNRSYTKSTKSRSNTSRKARQHNKSTSSSGSQGHGLATPSSSPTTSDQLPSGTTTSTVSTVKLPPIETMLGKSSNTALGQPGGSLQVQPENKARTSISQPLPQNGNKTSNTYTAAVSKPATTVATLLAAQLNKPIVSTSVPSSSLKLTPTTMGLVSTSALQASPASVPTGHLMFGPNNVVRFGAQLRFSPVRVPVSGASTGLRLSPRIVLRGGVSAQNQGIIVGQTPDGQTIIFQATPSSGVGAMQVQLSSHTGAQPQPVSGTSSVSGSGHIMNINSNIGGSTPTLATPSTLPTVALIQNSDKVLQNANVVRTSQIDASKIQLQPSSIVPAATNLAERPQHVNTAPQILKQVTTLTNSGMGAQTSPILIKSNQGNFIVPARIYGAGPVGEFKMVPLPGAGNQTVYARIVPQSSSSDLSSTPSVRFVSTPPSSTTPSSSQ